MRLRAPAPPPPPTSTPEPVDFLILGAGWTSTFLLPLLRDRNISHAATSTTGRAGTIKFKFEPLPGDVDDGDPAADNDDPADYKSARPEEDAVAPYRRLPLAATILITFPLDGAKQPRRLTTLYARAHGLPEPVPEAHSSSSSSTTTTPRSTSASNTTTTTTTITTTTFPHPHQPPHYILLGTSSIYTLPAWNTSTSPHDRRNARACAEDALLALAAAASTLTTLTAAPPALRATVLCLAGLYGGGREPRQWVGRVAGRKAQVKGKGALHLVHGADVARAVVGVVEVGAGVGSEGVWGRRWLVTDGWVYDWWGLFWAWGGGGGGGEGEEDGEGVKGVKGDGGGGGGGEGEGPALPYRRWVAELMLEEGVRALPRDVSLLGRCLDSRDFWKAVGILPSVGRVD